MSGRRNRKSADELDEEQKAQLHREQRAEPSPEAPGESHPGPRGSAEKDPNDWATGDEPMTGAQASYLKTLSEEAGESFDDKLTKSEASLRIDELRQRRDTIATRPAAAEGDAAASNTEKDPATWTTGDEPMTGAQASYLQTLSRQAGEPFDQSLNKAQASQRIDALRAKVAAGEQNPKTRG
jgi:hypothetical protein